MSISFSQASSARIEAARLDGDANRARDRSRCRSTPSGCRPRRPATPSLADLPRGALPGAAGRGVHRLDGHRTRDQPGRPALAVRDAGVRRPRAGRSRRRPTLGRMRSSPRRSSSTSAATTTRCSRSPSPRCCSSPPSRGGWSARRSQWAVARARARDLRDRGGRCCCPSRSWSEPPGLRPRRAARCSMPPRHLLLEHGAGCRRRRSGPGRGRRAPRRGRRASRRRARSPAASSSSVSG